MSVNYDRNLAENMLSLNNSIVFLLDGTSTGNMGLRTHAVGMTVRRRQMNLGCERNAREEAEVGYGDAPISGKIVGII